MDATAKIRRWMRVELAAAPEDYEDCGEVNTTKLAEDCAEALDLAGDDFNATIPDEVFDIAFDVARRWESGVGR